jgi:hypothetical protein
MHPTTRRLPISFQEKRAITTLVAEILVLVSYCLYAFGEARDGGSVLRDPKTSASTMLLFIAAGILAIVVIQVLFHVLFSMQIAISRRGQGEKEVDRAIDAAMIDDELIKLIELKASRIGSLMPALGFVAALAALVAGAAIDLMLNVVFLSFVAGGLAANCAQLAYFRKCASDD